jgi:hypothetical protein
MQRLITGLWGLAPVVMLTIGCDTSKNIVARLPAGPTPTVSASSLTGPASQAGLTSASRRMVINPGDDIQAAVDKAPAGTAFTIRGIHRRQTIKPKHDMTFTGESGAILDGEGVTARAFTGQGVRRVTIRNLRITGYRPPYNAAALDGIDGTEWVIEDNEIDNNFNVSNRAFGLRLGDDMVVRGNWIHHNGWVGLAGYEADRVLIERNEIYANPPAKVNDTIGEASNMKLFMCGLVTVRDNHVHDGPMIGMWFDTMKPGTMIEGNRVVNHGGAGIWYEVSPAATIRRNHVENAGYAGAYTSGWLHSGGIQITNSSDVSVLNNTVSHSLNGIVGHQAAGYPAGRYGPSELRNLLVQENTVIMPKGQTGIARNAGGDAVYESWNNQFVRNRYEIRSNATPFYWKGRGLTEREWKTGPGSTDTFSR